MAGLRAFWMMAMAMAMAALVALPGAAQEAHFTVHPEAVNPGLPAFTATIGGLGNGAELLRGGGSFEPAVFRDRMTATKDSPNTIFPRPQEVSNYDSWPEGMLDGAEIEVLRIIDGAFQTVRRDRVAKGGHLASGWLSLMPAGKMLPADMTSMPLTWDSFNRLDAPWFYTVRAVDASGRLSAPAPALAVQPPAKPGKPADKIAWRSVTPSAEISDTLSAPQALAARPTVSGTVLLSWAAVPKAAGYMVFRSAVPPQAHRGYAIVLEGSGSPIRKGDMILLRKKFYAPPRAEIATARVWGAEGQNSAFMVPLVRGMPGDPGQPPFRLVAHPAKTPVTDPGETYLQVDLKRGQKFALGKFNHAGPANTFYPTLNEGQIYRFEVWLRGRGRISARFGMGGLYKSVPGLPVEWSVGPDWTRHVVEFRAPKADPQSKQVGIMGLRLFGDGQVDIDSFRVYQTNAAFMDIRPEDRVALMDSGMAALRTHMFIKTGRSSYDLAQLTAPAGVPTQIGGHSLPQILGIMRSLGTDPWLQIEPHFSEAEWLGLAEYLAAPFDPLTDDPAALPWAARRVAQGHPAPWIDDFRQIYFEIGNETWNPLFAPWTFAPMTDAGLRNHTDYSAGEVYGLYQEHVLSILRESPWWDRLDPKFVPVIGGWSINDYGVDALARSPHSKVLTHAAYIGGWDSDEGAVRATPDGYASVMSYTPQRMAEGTKRFHDAVARGMPERKVVLGTYESGPGYALDGLNKDKVSPERAAEQERVMKSAAAGAATLDSFLTRATLGDRVQNFFLYGRGDKFRSHARMRDGGQAYPAWEWLALFNRIGAGGDLLRVETLSVPTRDLPSIERRKAMRDAPLAAAYALRRGGDLVVVALSRAVPGIPAGSDGTVSMRIDLPITGAKRVRRYAQTGDYRAENGTGPQTRIRSELMPLPSDPARLEIPALAPASAEIYVFEGADFTP